MRSGPIIRAVAAKYNVTVEDVLSHSRRARFIVPRREAIIEMLAIGLTVPRIAIIMNRDPTTIHYHISPLRYERRRKYQRAYQARKYQELKAMSA